MRLTSHYAALLLLLLVVIFSCAITPARAFPPSLFRKFAHRQSVREAIERELNFTHTDFDTSSSPACPHLVQKRLDLSEVEESPAERTVQANQVPSLTRINDLFHVSYNYVRNDLMQQTTPFVIVLGDKLVLLNGTTVYEADITAPAFHNEKSVAHAPLGVYMLLQYNFFLGIQSSQINENQLEQLNQYAETIPQVIAELPSWQENDDDIEENKKILLQCLELVNRIRDTRVVEEKDVVAFARQMGKLVQRNVHVGTGAMLQKLHQAMMYWKENVLSAEEWKQLRVIIPGSHMPRQDNAYTQYFARLLGEEGEGTRIAYAESVSEIPAMLRLAASLVIDRYIGIHFFDNSVRMYRDLLGDSAKVHIDSIFGPPEPSHQQYMFKVIVITFLVTLSLAIAVGYVLFSFYMESLQKKQQQYIAMAVASAATKKQPQQRKQDDM